MTLSARAAPTRSAMVGDHARDVAAGRACGTAAIGVAWGYGTREELREGGAEAIAERVSELCAIVLARTAP